MRPVIDQEKCQKCNNCLTACNEGNYLRDNGEILILEDAADTCTGCAVCVVECPGDAITLVA